MPFEVISSRVLLGATIDHHLDSYRTEISDKLKSDIYVDNLITGTNSVDEAKKDFTLEPNTCFTMLL